MSWPKTIVDRGMSASFQDIFMSDSFCSKLVLSQLLTGNFFRLLILLLSTTLSETSALFCAAVDCVIGQEL